MFRGFAALVFGSVLTVPAAAQPPRTTDHPPHPDRLFAEAVARVVWYGPDHPLVRHSEPAAMLAAILKGGSMGGGSGWFRPGTSRYDWPWLAARYGLVATDQLARRSWRGPADTFDRLDRNHDGVLSAADFDFSESSALTRDERLYRQWLTRFDTDGNGRISRKEWERLFDKLAAGKDQLSLDDLRQAFPLAPPAGGKAAGKQPPPGFQQTLLKGLFASELGSPFSGPRAGQPAPDFTLPTHDGKQQISLSDYRGKKPVVLIFGSFT